jgi:hypothetical protein
MCQPGEYCVTGSGSAKVCEPGRFCKDFAQGVQAGRCEAGYYCPAGAVKANAFPCPAGYFCGEGAIAPTPCGVGTYSESIGASDSSTCVPCPPGFACLQEGLVSPYTTSDPAMAGRCPAGFYCDPGSATNDEADASSLPTSKLHPCEPGYQCPAGALT